MSDVVERLLIEIEAKGADATLTRLQGGLSGVGSKAVDADKRVRQFGEGQGRLSRASAGVDRALRGQIAQLAALGGAYLSIRAVIDGIGGSVRIFTEFEATLAAVQAVTNATAVEFANLKQQAKELGEATIFSGVEAAQAQELLARAGFRVSEVIGALPGLLDLAAAAQLGLGEATDITAQALRGFNLESDQSGRVADVLAAAAANANTNVQMLGEGMSYIAPVAAAVGISIEEAAAAMGVLSDAGLQGTMAGTGLRQIISGLIDPTKEAAEALAALGVSAEEINPSTNSLIGIAERLAAANIDAATAFTVLGDRGAPALLALVSQAPRLRELTGVIEDADGTSKRMAATMLDTVKGAADELDSVIESLRIEFGEGLAPALRENLALSTEFFGTQGAAAEAFGRRVGAALSTVVRALLFVADNIHLVSAALTVLLVRAAGLQAASLVAVFIGWIQHLQQVALGAQLATAAENRLTAAVAANAVVIGASGTVADLYAAELHGVAGSVVATGTVLDLYDARLIKTTVTTGVATAATGAHAVASNVATGAIIRTAGATTVLGVAMERLKIAFATNPVTIIITALSILVGVLLLVKSRTAEAAEAQEDYNDRLRFGSAEVEAATRAHAELITKLEREIEVRRELQGLLSESAARLAQLQPILEAAETALAGGDTEGYRAAIAAAKELGVAFSSIAGDSGLERLRLEVRALETDLARASTGIEQSGAAIKSVEDAMAASAEQTLDAELRLRIEQRARLADIESLAANAEVAMHNLMAAGGDENSGFFVELAKARAELGRLAADASAAADELERTNQRILEFGQAVNVRLGQMFRTGDMEGFEALLRSLPQDLFHTVFGEASDVEAVLKAYQEARVRLDEYAESQRKGAGETNRLSDEQKKQLERFQELRTELLAQIAGLEDVARAYESGVVAGERAVGNLELEARIRQVTKDLTEQQAAALEDLVRAQAQAEARATGAASIADLLKQVDAQGALVSAYHGGRAALEAARRANALAEKQHEATAGAADEQVDTIRELVRILFNLERSLETLQVRDDLRRELDQLEDLRDAYETNANAVMETVAAQELQNEIHEKTAGLVEKEAKEIEELIRTRARLRAEIGAGARVAALEEETRQTRELAAVKREDFATEDQYQAAIRAVNVERQVRLELLAIEAERMAALATITRDAFATEAEYLAALAEVNRTFADFAQRAEVAIRAKAALDHQMSSQDGLTTFDKWVEAGHALAEVLRDVDEELANLVESAANLLDAFQNMSAEGGKLKAVVAGLGVVQAVGTAITGPNNYAAEGALVGAIVGLIIGAYAGDPATGAQVGAAAGGALGSFIKKGSDEFLAEFELTAMGGLEGVATKVEGALGSVGRQFIEAIERGLAAALDALGAFLVGIPDVSIKVRDGIYSVFVGAVTARFNSMAEAVDFAILEVLRQGDIIGLSDEVKTAIENSTAESFAALAQDIDFARWVERLPEIGQLASDSATALLNAVDQYQAALRKANELGLDTAKIDQWFAHTLDAIRKNVLGIVETNEERIKREVLGFNQTVMLLRAEQEMRRADLLMKKAELGAELALLAAKHKISLADLQAMAAHVAAQGRLTQAMMEIGKATLEMVNAMFQALAAIDVALATVDSILAGLPELISDQELEDALNRAGQGGGGQRKREREEALAEIEALRLEASGMAASAISLRQGFADFETWIADARKLGIAEEQLAQARRDNLAITEREFRARFEGVLLGDGPAGSIQALIDDYRTAFDEAAEIARERAKVMGTTFEEEFAKLAALVGDAFGKELRDLVTGEIGSLIAAGDLSGLQELLDVLMGISTAGLPPEMIAVLQAIPGLAEQIRQAIDTLQEAGLEGGTPGLDLSPIREDLDRARGLSETDVALREIAQRFAAVRAQAELLGASQQELIDIELAHRSAIEAVRQAVLESVQEYTDAVLGIGEYQRRLIDLQDTFRAAREGLAAADDALAGLEDPDTARGNEIVERRVQAIEDIFISGLDRLVEAIADRFGIDPGDLAAGREPEGERDRGATEGLDAIREVLESLLDPGLTAREVLEGLIEAIRGVREDAGSGGRSLDGLGDAIDGIRDTIRGVAGAFDTLTEAERRAVRALGVDFIGSLEDLGVALPTDLVLELAEAQFALAQAEAISSALALAAAGAFEGLSITLADLLELIAGASFDASSFGRGFGGGSPRPSPDRDPQQELDRVRQQIADQARQWRDLLLDPFTRQLLDMQRRFSELSFALAEAGGSAAELADLEDALGAARQHLIDQQLQPIRDVLRDFQTEGPGVASRETLHSLESQFAAAIARVEGGDFSAIQDATDLARRLREVGAGFFGTSSGAFEHLVDTMEAQLQAILDSGVEPNIPEETLDVVTENRDLTAQILSEFRGFRDQSKGQADALLTSRAQELVEILGRDDITQGQLQSTISQLLAIASLENLVAGNTQAVWTALGGLLSVKDQLSPQQLAQLQAVAQTLLGVEGLSDAQRDLLEDILGETGDTARSISDSVAAQIALKITQLQLKAVADSQLSELKTHTDRLASIRDWLKSIDATLKAMPSFQGGGLMPSDGLAFLHAGEQVLTPGQTAHYEALLRSSSAATLRPDLLSLSSGAIASGARQAASEFASLLLRQAETSLAFRTAAPEQSVRIILPPPSTASGADAADARDLRRRLEAQERQNDLLVEEIRTLNKKIDRLADAVLASVQQGQPRAGGRANP